MDRPDPVGPSGIDQPAVLGFQIEHVGGFEEPFLAGFDQDGPVISGRYVILARTDDVADTGSEAAKEIDLGFPVTPVVEIPAHD